ncbi:hypothetical protein FNF29_03943 [Cafeteria roenbergensis]|uniref:FAD/NAD(P)-binding domain-containing protein n=1 Tax=Cafeteria roenbergensis TaxID=33653 RepID=A0A5A8CIE2_CAFRO|nr:hypothetical protein FNF29_03943 [Cafeteria roenbergensis]|eukprot:KAA0152377.1 hypothetical protein FNF29_03943 [Cafeteria roenbergensis]
MGNCCAKVHEDRKVIIVGGGYAGTWLARRLDATFDVTVLERNEAFVHVMGQLRAVTDPEYAPRSLIPYTGLLKRGTVQRANVKQVYTDRVVLEDGATIHIRPGKDFLRVTIVHRGPFLCSGKAGADKGETVPKAFGDELKAVCEARSIAVRVGTRVDAGADADPSAGFTVPSGPVTLSDGSTLGDVDLVVWATGSRPNNAALVGSMDDKLDAAGRVKVAESLLVPGTDNVFAIGDCAESHGPKTAYHGRMQADLVAKSIAALAGGAATDSLGTFSAGGAAMLVPIGSTAGRAYLPFCGGLTIGDGKVSSIKGKDLFTAQTHKEMGTPE